MLAFLCPAVLGGDGHFFVARVSIQLRMKRFLLVPALATASSSNFFSNNEIQIDTYVVFFWRAIRHPPRFCMFVANARYASAVCFP